VGWSGSFWNGMQVEVNQICVDDGAMAVYLALPGSLGSRTAVCPDSERMTGNLTLSMHKCVRLVRGSRRRGMACKAGGERCHGVLGFRWGGGVGVVLHHKPHTSWVRL
jgi:hypothetical protein